MNKITMNKTKINKRGFLIVLEATIAMLILFGFLFVSLEKQNQITTQSYSRESQNAMLLQYLQDFIEENREQIIDENIQELNNGAKNYLSEYNSGLEVSITVCPINDNCVLNIPANKEVSTKDFLFAYANNNVNNELKIKQVIIAIWNK